jgi:acetoacetyl-CoA synthetase
MLWEADKTRKESSEMYKYMKVQGKKSYQDLYDWSVSENATFWTSLIDYFEIIHSGEKIQTENHPPFIPYSWFPKMKLNFAQNLLRHKDSNQVALNFVHESGLQTKTTYKELYEQVAKFQAEIKDLIAPGDVLACYMPNVPQTAVAMLATTALGGVFTSTSSDFGVGGVTDRFGQSKPKVLVAASSYEYNGKLIDQSENLKEIQKSIPSIEKIITVDFLDKGISFDGAAKYEKIMNRGESEVTFTQMNFSDPLYIMYSSGTTGKPKCIVHGIGGTLLQHVKELGLHTDLTDKKKIFYFTTCGWMMWNWLISSLYFGAEVVLYEGSPAYPSLEKFLEFIDKEKVNIWGTSPKFLRAIEQYVEKIPYQFNSLETMLSTGAPLLPEQFDYVYEKIKKDILLGSISGGTDIISCFMLGNPILPVNRGEIQCLGLGMDVSSFNSKGEEVLGIEGELVCRNSFPSQPIGFLNDSNNEKFKNAYFNVFENIWHHGDFITLTKNKTVQVHGRSDATLNPGGVRIGTAEIYRQTELLDYIDDSLCVGRQVDGDVEVVLFVLLKKGEKLDQARVKEIKTKIKENTTPRHVPKNVYQVLGIPYTRSGKKMELAITRVLAGRELNNIEAMVNPDVVKEYEQYASKN